MSTLTGLLFPGQGSQSIGMGKSIYEECLDAKQLLDASCDILHMDMKSILFYGTEEELRQTEITQPAIYIVSAMYLKKFQSLGIPYHVVAGHSLGEYSALYAAGVFGFEEGLSLIQKRGQAMSMANGTGTMYAVLGIDEKEVEDRIAGIDEVVIANANSKTQIIISGSKSALKQVVLDFESLEGVKVKQLNVSGAFHSPMMGEAKKIMDQEIDKITFAKPKVDVIPNITGQPTLDEVLIKNCLKEQITGKVKWMDSILAAKENGVDIFYEVGAGDVLKKLNKTIVFRPKCLSIV